METAIAALAFVATVVAHGAAHWVAARRAGQPAGVTTFLPGLGCTACARQVERRGARIAVHLAGPVASYLAIVGVAFALFATTPMPAGRPGGDEVAAAGPVSGGDEPAAGPVRARLSIGAAAGRAAAFPAIRSGQLFASFARLFSPAVADDPGGPVRVARAFDEADQPPLVRALRPMLDAAVLLALALGLLDVALAIAAAVRRG